MHVYIASDHTGVEQRKHIVKHLQSKGYDVFDLGTNDSVSNYAELGLGVGEAVINDPNSFGIVICGTGIGISIATNKVQGVRCALVDRKENASLVKEHNNANVLALGARTTPLSDMLEIVDTFINSEYEGGRHQVRLDTITEYEDKNHE